MRNSESKITQGLLNEDTLYLDVRSQFLLHEH
ncbi:hypothetical protein FLACOL7796_03841 [Flavobacterium collinsii]|uniref:Uncharacterized protein n=1 Tax=Flavobacterium collinsii TaxID=1114861 RepID=A0ABN7ERR5_9FLAO|nr:hypothetical protein FLACOL7796_03841 [Flavobacterium collinsii]